MSDLDLHWETSYNRRGDAVRRELYCGQQPTCLAVVTKREKWWDSYVTLGELYTDRRYAPEEVMVAMVEDVVRNFLTKLLTPRQVAQVPPEERAEVEVTPGMAGEDAPLSILGGAPYRMYTLTSEEIFELLWSLHG